MEDSLKPEDRLTNGRAFVFEPHRILASAQHLVFVRRAELMCAVLLAAAAFQMLSVITRKSITVDEIVMIPSSYYHLVTGNFQLVNDHPPFAKFLAALPLLFIQPNEIQRQQIEGAPQSEAEEWSYLITFWENNPASFETISFWTRVPMIALTVGLGVLIFVFARELFGSTAAVLAVALFSLEPTVLAHGRVVQTDIPAAFSYLLFSFMLYRYLPAPTLRRATWLGIAAALAILAKFSMLLVGPILLLTFIALWWRAEKSGRTPLKVVGHAAVIGLVILLVIQAAYYFHSRQIVDADVFWVKKSFPGQDVMVLPAVRALSYVLPTDFVLGVFWQFWHNKEGHPASLLGMYGRTGWWYYFPVAFALKTTIPFLLISLASLGWAAREVVRKRDPRFLALLIPFVIYTVFVLFSRIDIGVRYYLPAYPFLFILGGALLDRLLRSRRARRVGTFAAVVLFCWMGWEAVRAYPNHMTYMNQLASRAPHWWSLSDSNVEWGDDARELALYLRARGETKVRTAFLGDFVTLHHYGVEAIGLMSPSGDGLEPTHYIAIGASFLNGSTVPQRKIHDQWLPDSQRVNFFDDYRHRTPEAVIGNSIYLYRVRE